MCQPYGQSLSGATGVSTGDVVDYGEYKATHTVAVTLTGSPASYNVSLYLSQDGVNWWGVGSVSSLSVSQFHSGSKVARYARANLTSLTGGTSPTVSATIAGA